MGVKPNEKKNFTQKTSNKRAKIEEQGQNLHAQNYGNTASRHGSIQHMIIHLAKSRAKQTKQITRQQTQGH